MVYGVGSVADNFYVKSHNELDRNELVSNLQNRVEELTLKNLEQIKELENTNTKPDETIKTVNEKIYVMKTIQEQVCFLTQNVVHP